MARKGENIYKRKDKRWEARYIKGYHSDGRAKYGYCYAVSYSEVKKKVYAAKAALLTDISKSDISKKRRFTCYCDEWLLMNRTRVKESTYVKYNTVIQNHIKPKLGGCLVQALSSLIVEQFSYELLYEEELSPKTVKDILVVLNSVLKYTAKQFPQGFPKIEIVYPKDIKKEMRVLTRTEQTVFAQYLLEDIDECKFGVLLALLTGMRIGEICALKWENVCLKDRIIKVSSTMQRLHDFSEDSKTKTRVVISNPKSDTSARLIPLTDYALKLCKAQVTNEKNAFVLTGSKDSYIEPRTMQYKLKRYTSDCGLAGVHFHTLRHTFATRCVEVDFELKSLSEILGHSSPKITLERYVHSSMELKRDNMNKLAAVGL